MKSINLDESKEGPQIEYTLSGVKFPCFPLDEIDVINEQVEAGGEAAKSGGPFLQILHRRLDLHNVKTSDKKAYKWYQSLISNLKEQEDFTEGSVATGDATATGPSNEN